MLLALCLFFFFQAEDGIRDVAVTGVQTCALPISTRAAVADTREAPRTPGSQTRRREARAASRRPRPASPPPSGRTARTPTPCAGHPRSEERRVGKEWRAQRAPDSGTQASTDDARR